MVSSGTEATLATLRLARGYTGRNKIIKFEGCYHGHSDSLLIKAGSGVATLGLPDSPGVPEGTAKNTITVPYNDLEAIKIAFENYGDDIIWNYRRTSSLVIWALYLLKMDSYKGYVRLQMTMGRY